MATQLIYHLPIKAVATVSGNTPFTKSTPEKAAQTFPSGAPVQINAGYIQVWDGATVALGIAGVTLIPAANLTTNGQGAPTAFGSPVGAPGSTIVYSAGQVQNEPAAVKIPVGAPFTDGRTLYEVANADTIFEAQVDNANASGGGNITPAITDIGKQYGLTVDASGLWYVDYNKNTAGTNTVVEILKINPVDFGQANARVQFQFIPAARQVGQ
jgi:hypothetical protein